MAVLYNQIKDNFTQIPNELLIDNSLSMGAKVVFCYVASKPTGWKVWNKEIQQALNIKDSSTMSKYWKELIDAGWIDRTRTKMDNGQFTGGYDYELRIEPIKDETRITKNPTYGENPEHINTELNINTNINKNTNINSPDGQEKEISNNIDITNNGQLFKTSSKPKKKNENQYNTVIENLSSNPQIRESLQKYCNFRRKRGLTVEQWQLIVSKFKEDSKGKSIQEVISCIERCIIDGCNSLYYKQSYNNKPKQSEPQNYEDMYAEYRNS